MDDARSNSRVNFVENYQDRASAVFGGRVMLLLTSLGFAYAAWSFHKRD